jgi:hypothetical protein
MRHTEHEPAAEAGHETSDVSIGAIVKFGIGLAAVVLLVHLATWGLFRVMDAREEKRDRPLPPLVAAALRRTPPGPRLEPDALSPRRRMQAEENAALTTYGWVDRDAGIVRMPIERAMEILVERGLPPPKPMAPTPGPGNGHGSRLPASGSRSPGSR